MCEKALSAELIQYPKSDLPTQYYLHLAQLKLQMRQYDVAEKNIEEALIHDYTVRTYTSIKVSNIIVARLTILEPSY